MEKALTREEMRELDRTAIEDYQIPGIILMENAGRNVVEEVLKMLPGHQNRKIAVLCGKGNNGGDGFVIARHLHNKNISTEVFLFAKTSEILKHGDAGTNLRILINMKVAVREVLDLASIYSVVKNFSNYDLLIDALFGTGLSGIVREPFKTLIKGVNDLNKTIISVDIPSGLDCNNGNVLGAAVKASKTVTFAVNKRGFSLGDGPDYTGDVVVTDISIPKELLL